MLDRLQTFFQSLTAQPKDRSATDDPLLSVAALCFQVMEADGAILDEEREKLKSILTQTYGVDERRLISLMEAAQLAESEAVDYYRFTNDLKRHLEPHERENLIGILWDIVYADGVRSEMEDHVIWRIADLLGVSNRERVNQRMEAASRAGIGKTDDAS
ncbi:TerB family tellurite resistance protein [Peteryoungia desertarenae]|uniref:TerB family tellurite resistance protein n=1 Tax=Peteryoungia desertarenae TaxID=1813451 RepID=A0ABX6QJD9_9HYPH|nr:TerB family tellurite resistance protein [Peteryoungia desertarenae]QLF68676.1 TerB family tellurite resistance protein [Peteryoungia desertarenae]